MLVRDARARGCGGDGAMVNSGEGRIWTWKYGSQTDVGVAAGLKYITGSSPRCCDRVHGPDMEAEVVN